MDASFSRIGHTHSRGSLIPRDGIGLRLEATVVNWSSFSLDRLLTDAAIRLMGLSETFVEPGSAAVG